MDLGVKGFAPTHILVCLAGNEFTKLTMMMWKRGNITHNGVTELNHAWKWHENFFSIGNIFYVLNMNEWVLQRHSIFPNQLVSEAYKKQSEYLICKYMGEKCISRLNWPFRTAKYICECPNTPMYINRLNPLNFIQFISFWLWFFWEKIHCENL